MKFTELTDSDKEYIRDIHANTTLEWDVRMNVLKQKYDKSERTVRKWISKLGYSNRNGEEIEIPSEQFKEAQEKVHADKRYYMITWAQNDTDINVEMLRNMEAYADHIDAEILVIAGRYRNPTSLRTSDNLKEKEKLEMSWDSKVLPYLTANRHNIHKYVQVLADVKVQPTAYNPLSGFEGFSGLESSILGHPKQHLKSLPILDGYPHKVLASTGAITHPRYTDTKIGKKGEFNHIYGFLLVEVRDEEVFHIRNVNVNDDGSFTDVYSFVKNGAIKETSRLEGLVLGDLHSGFENERVLEETFRIIRELRPKKVVIHDVFDGYSISHHHEKDPFLKYKKHQNEEDDLDLEIENMLELLGMFVSECDGEVNIVRSNHDDHCDRYLRDRDWKKDIRNSESYMELALAILKGKADKGVIPYKINERFPEINCLGANESLNIADVECGMHGDIGANGSRGSINQFSKLNVKTITGHSHTPVIFDGAYSVGTSTELRLEYNKGASSWMNAHVTIDRFGKRQMILFVDGKFTTLNE